MWSSKNKDTENMKEKLRGRKDRRICPTYLVGNPKTKEYREGRK